MSDALLTLNAGSSSVKASLRDAAAGEPAILWSGRAEGIGADCRISSSDVSDLASVPDVKDHAGAMRWAIETAMAARPDVRIAAVGHRVVHGGRDYAAPTLVDDAVFAALKSLSPLAPGHQPHNLAGVEYARSALPDALQVACFDTAFHASMPRLERLFALPRGYAARGVLRYGFHGLSYAYIARRLPDFLGEKADGRVIVAHLGAGASLCAMRARRSVATTMGFTALEGPPMGTRCGSIDPGVLLYLLNEEGMSPASLADLLHNRSGLLGVSGVSADMRALLGSPEPAAAEAVALFVYRIAREIGSLAAALGGLDALVFTGGVGENAAPVRARVCALSSWLGVMLDAGANDARSAEALAITTPDSPIAAWVIPTDEEQEIASGAREVLAEACPH